MIIGLRNGTYDLVETKAPAGYQKSQKPIPFKINAQHNSEQAILKVVN